MVTFLEGKSVERHNHAVFLKEAGKYNALFHVYAQDYAQYRDNDLSIEGWNAILQKAAPDIHSIIPNGAKELHDEYKFLSQNWPDSLPISAGHLDLFPNNVFFEKDQLSGVIDFYFSAHDYMIYDIAVTLTAWVFDKKGHFHKEMAQAFLHAYQQVRTLSAEEKEALPFMLRGAAMRFLSSRLYDWLHVPDDSFVIKHDPMDFYRILHSCQTLKKADFFS